MSNDKINKCKQRARQLKKARAELTHCQRVAIEKPGISGRSGRWSCDTSGCAHQSTRIISQNNKILKIEYQRIEIGRQPRYSFATVGVLRPHAHMKTP